MARLGSYEYPEIALSESIELGGRIAREFAGEVSRHGLSRALGMAERGGAFAARIGSMRMWGIVTGRSRLRVSRDGLRAASPLSPQEAVSARRALAGNVPLFEEMADRIGDAPYDPARLAILLEELTGAGRQDVSKRLPVIDRVFGEIRLDLPRGRTAEPAQASEPAVGGGSAGDETPEPAAPPDSAAALDRAAGVEPSSPAGDAERIELILPGGRLSLPETISNLDAALTVLWARRQLVAASEAERGRPAPAPPRDFPGQ